MWIEGDGKCAAGGQVFRRRAAAAVACAALALVAVPADAALVDLGNVAAITTGGQHSCVLTRAGAAKCWGWNAEGQLGDGTTTARPTPVGVAGLAVGVAAIAAGESHTCALTTGGGVKCWGANEHGQLGIGTSAGSPQPVNLAGLASGVKAIAAGGYHTCALTTAGGVKCWGRAGTVGNGTHEGSLVPVNVLGLEIGVAAISAGGFHTCALTVSGTVQCWGLNVDGQLGDGSTIDRTTPESVSGLPPGMLSVAAGTWHTCGVTAAGGARCWGNNSYGQIGAGTPPASRVTVPVDVAGLASGVRALSGGYGHTCAATASGGIKCWGANELGQLGDATVTQRLVPVNASGATSGMSAVAAGAYHTCAVTASAGAACWGANDGGQLGDAGDGDRAQAAPVRIATHPLAVAKFGTSAGTVRSSPAGVDCGGTCSAEVPSGDLVTLSAIPAAGAYLKQWGGDCSGSGSCVVVMDGAKTVTATFDLANNLSRLVNLSARAPVGTGDEVMIGGFVIGGSSPKPVLILARGPSLADFGVAGTLANPQVTLVDQVTGAVLGFNDDWGSAANANEISATGKAPSRPAESAILATLNPGPYTAVVSGARNTAGVGIVEVFELGRPDVPLLNLSTRGRVLTNDGVMIGGFVVSGSAPQTILVLARGPSLADFGVPGVLANPQLTLVEQGTGAVVGYNDDWQKAANAVDIAATGKSPSRAAESAILVTLNPGAYTAVVSGVGGTTGVAIVEVFAR